MLLVSLTGAPCDREERRTACSYECIWVDIFIKRAKPWEFVWCRTGMNVKAIHVRSIVHNRIIIMFMFYYYYLL